MVVSLGSAWGVLEATGQSNGPKSRTSFLAIYFCEAIPAIIVVTIISGYIQLMLNMMFIFPIVLIPSLYFLGKLVAKKEVMNGNQYKRNERIAFWVAASIVIAGGLIGVLGTLPFI